uniref:Uncharacterized protein n=1 Tax=Salix viminalis TaxID=40686 RepID=A0A6N2M674_SALVM
MANEFKQIIYPLQLICNQYWLINSQRLQEDFLSRTRLPSDNNSSFDEAGLLERSTRDGFKKEKVDEQSTPAELINDPCSATFLPATKAGCLGSGRATFSFTIIEMTSDIVVGRALPVCYPNFRLICEVPIPYSQVNVVRSASAEETEFKNTVLRY